MNTCGGVFLIKLLAEFLFNKVACLETRCFPVKFAKFLKTPFFTERFRWLLLPFQVSNFCRPLRNWETNMFSNFFWSYEEDFTKWFYRKGFSQVWSHFYGSIALTSFYWKTFLFLIKFFTEYAKAIIEKCSSKWVTYIRYWLRF